MIIIYCTTAPPFTRFYPIGTSTVATIRINL